MSIMKNNKIIAVGDVNTNTYRPPILSCMWSDHIINDISWLRADTFSWQSGDVYKTVYNKLVEEYSTGAEETEGSITFKRTTNGFKIATANQETVILNKYNTEGIAWYYILDTENRRFKLPRTKFGFEGLRTNVGDDIAESLPNINGSFNVVGSIGDTDWSSNTNKHTGAFYPIVVKSGLQAFAQGTTNTNDNTNKVGLDASLSSSTYQDNAPVQERATQMYLYFYVGEYAQSAIEQTAGITTEQLNNKVDTSSLSQIYPVIKTYVSGTSGYRIWSDGYCEQWGRFSGYNTSVTITFTKKWKDTNYGIYQGEIGRAGSDPYINGVFYSSLTTNSVVAVLRNDGTNTYMWKAYGYLAEGQY